MAESDDGGGSPRSRWAAGVGDVAGERRTGPRALRPSIGATSMSFLALCDPDSEYFSHLVELEGGGPYRGHDGIRSWWKAFSPSPRTSGRRSRRYEILATSRLRDCALMATEGKRRAHGADRNGTSPSGATGRRSGGAFFSARPKPSKPPGCGSRRCRRRTWRSCGASLRTPCEVAGNSRRCTSGRTPSCMAPSGGSPGGDVWRGSEQVRKFFEEDSDAWDERPLDAEEFIDAGDCVVVLLHEFRRGKGAGLRWRLTRPWSTRCVTGK